MRLGWFIFNGDCLWALNYSQLSRHSEEQRDEESSQRVERHGPQKFRANSSEWHLPKTVSSFYKRSLTDSAQFRAREPHDSRSKDCGRIRWIAREALQRKPLMTLQIEVFFSIQ